jgi:hypothetical protein
LAAIRLGQSKLASGTVQPKPAGILELVGETAGIDQQLLGHAAADDAGAADAIRYSLGQPDPDAETCRDPSRAHAAGAATDNEQIIVVVVRAHVG